MYADQRYYTAQFGRFMTADRSDLNIDRGNPTSWNRYAYTNGDPVNGTDPSGLELQDDGLGPVDSLGFDGGGGCGDDCGSDDRGSGDTVYDLGIIITVQVDGAAGQIGGPYAGIFSGPNSVGNILQGSDGLFAPFLAPSVVAAGTAVAGTAAGLDAIQTLAAGGSIVGSGVLNGLAPEIADNFTDGAAELVTTASNLNLTRVFDGTNSFINGQYWTTSQITSSAQAQEIVSLSSEFNNATYAVQGYLPPGQPSLDGNCRKPFRSTRWRWPGLGAFWKLHVYRECLHASVVSL